MRGSSVPLLLPLQLEAWQDTAHQAPPSVHSCPAGMNTEAGSCGVGRERLRRGQGGINAGSRGQTIRDSRSSTESNNLSRSNYPTGASKWNPIEHRLFSEISKNWAGRPLDSYETMLHYIRSTATTTGLRVKAQLVRRRYTKGIKISDEHMRRLRIKKHETQPARNYTLSPRSSQKAK